MNFKEAGAACAGSISVPGRGFAENFTKRRRVRPRGHSVLKEKKAFSDESLHRCVAVNEIAIRENLRGFAEKWLHLQRGGACDFGRNLCSRRKKRARVRLREIPQNNCFIFNTARAASGGFCAQEEKTFFKKSLHRCAAVNEVEIRKNMRGFAEKWLHLQRDGARAHGRTPCSRRKKRFSRKRCTSALVRDFAEK